MHAKHRRTMASKQTSKQAIKFECIAKQASKQASNQASKQAITGSKQASKRAGKQASRQAPNPHSSWAPASLAQLPFPAVRTMAFPKFVLFGVGVRIPKKRLSALREALRKRLAMHPCPGEDAGRMGQRAAEALREMGIHVSPLGHQDAGALQASLPVGIHAAPSPHANQPATTAPRPHKTKGSPLFLKRRGHPQKAMNFANAPGCNSQMSANGDHSESWTRAHLQTTGRINSGTAIFQTEEENAFIATGSLGRGSFGAVFGGTFRLGQEPLVRVAVAVKVLPRDQTFKTDSAINKEIECLEQLAHPCILHLYSVSTTTFNVQLFLQLHEMSLYDFLQQTPSEAKAKGVAQFVLRGLAHMHAMGYVHRDLKPLNILVNSRPLAAVISDLGSAHFGEAGQGTCTTITSRAPETMLGQPFGQKSDIWSLGCTLAEVEQRRFFRGPLNAYRDLDGNGNETQFMKKLVEILLPHERTKGVVRPVGLLQPGHGSRSKFEVRLDKGLLQRGAVAPGVVGTRFQVGFHPFMEKLLHFQAQARATAVELLGDPWLLSLDA